MVSVLLSLNHIISFSDFCHLHVCQNHGKQFSLSTQATHCRSELGYGLNIVFQGKNFTTKYSCMFTISNNYLQQKQSRNQ